MEREAERDKSCPQPESDAQLKGPIHKGYSRKKDKNGNTGKAKQNAGLEDTKGLRQHPEELKELSKGPEELEDMHIGEA